MGIASGSFCFSSGSDCVRPFDSLASTFCVSTGLAGKGTLLTIDTPIASPPPPAPQVSPRRAGRITAKTMINPVIARCRLAERASGPARFPRSRKMSASAAMLFQRLGHDAYVGYAGSLDGVHHRGKSAKRHVLIGAHINRLVLGVADFLVKFGLDLVDVDGIVAEKYALLLVDADHQSFLGDFLHGAGFRNVDFDARLQHGSRDHEDDQKHKHHVD